MNTALAIQNTGDGTRVYPEAIRDFRIAGAAAFHVNNCDNVIIGEFSNEGGLQAILDGVGMVPQSVYPLQVGHCVVGLVSINMVDLREIGWIGDESRSNETMDGCISEVRLVAQVDARVSTQVGLGSHDDARMVSFPTFADTNANAVSTSDTTEGADLVKSSELDNFDRSPFFDHRHLSACMLASSNMAQRLM